MLRYVFRHSFCLFIFILVFTGFSSAVSGQESKPEEPIEACKELPPLKEFHFINDLRAKLQGEVTELLAKKKDLEEVKIPAAEVASKTAEPGANNSVNTKVSPVLTPIKSVEEYKNDLKQTVDDISWKQAQLQCVISAQSQFSLDFKFSVSLFFAALIGLVITGFFVLAIIDEKVRQAVFSGQVGLQFLALFSIVIAIILFGITTILEAKELAALLGSLSGYILGRTTASNGNNTETQTKPNPNPMDNFAAIDLTPATLSIAIGATDTLKATPLDKQNKPIIPSAGEFTPQWSSNDPSVAQVDGKGTVTGVSAGTCNVVTRFNGVQSASSVVTVS
jgi:Bacterial Ig-like domain (group 2)